MRIAIASGKGGTGKTTVSTNLALLLAELGKAVNYLDCDVEEPNGHLFLKPDMHHQFPSFIPVPHVDESKCIACGACVQFCEYNALVRLGKVVMLFPELCHGCGGCTIVCPQRAISEVEREIGLVEQGTSGSIGFVHGRLTIGEVMSPPLIRDVLKRCTENQINIIDAPPGTSCPVIASLRGADFVVLVTEPTPFGLNDLGLALAMVRELSIPHGVVINRAEAMNRDALDFCRENQVAVLAEIPDDRSVAAAYSHGSMILDVTPVVRRSFETLWNAIRERVAE